MTEVSHQFQFLPLSQLRESATNPRKHFNQEGLADLITSVKQKGVLVPLLVRPLRTVNTFEIIAGARRYRAAKAAGVTDVPVRICTMTDEEVLEVQVIENLQREDVHPLDEAKGYEALMHDAKYDVARIAERVGRSVKYIYDRVKLLTLTGEAQDLFWSGKITAGHAILLARLSPADQQRAIGTEQAGYCDGGLFMGEHVLFKPEDERDEAEIKPVSVRELQGWIDRNVRFEAAKAEPLLYPDTVEVVQAAKEDAEKIIPITYDHHVHPDAKDGTRTYGPMSWKRADGRNGSKPCDRSVTGVLVVGPGRGEAFKVCTDKKQCTVHWGQELREAKKRATEATKGGGSVQDQWKRQEEKQKEERARQEAAQARWKKATPAILKAVAAAVKKAPAKSGGLLGDMIVKEVTPWNGAKVDSSVPRGLTAEDLVRHAAFIILHHKVNGWDAFEEFPKRAKAFGIDVKKILDGVAPIPTEKKPVKTSAKGKKKTRAA